MISKFGIDMFLCRIVLSRNVTEINSSEHAQKKNHFVEEARKVRLVKVWWTRSFWIVILLALISKYWTIYLHQSVSIKLSWCKTWRLKPKTNSLYDNLYWCWRCHHEALCPFTMEGQFNRSNWKLILCNQGNYFTEHHIQYEIKLKLTYLQQTVKSTSVSSLSVKEKSQKKLLINCL